MASDSVDHVLRHTILHTHLTIRE